MLITSVYQLTISLRWGLSPCFTDEQSPRPYRTFRSRQGRAEIWLSDLEHDEGKGSFRHELPSRNAQSDVHGKGFKKQFQYSARGRPRGLWGPSLEIREDFPEEVMLRHSPGR